MTSTPSGVRHEYVTITEAVARLGVSERSVRRAIASGRLASHVEAGRRVVAVEVTSGERQTTGNPHDAQSIEASGSTSGGAMIEHRLAEAVSVIVTEHRQAVRRARRAARIGWSAAFAAGILAALGAVWHVRVIGRAEGRLAAAEAAAGVWQRQAAAERQRAADRVVVVEAGSGWPGTPYP